VENEAVMNDFCRHITDQINGDIANGLTPREAVEKAGAKKLSGCNSVYYIAYGLYEDRALFINVHGGDENA
jgi:hypothetical protein